MTLMEVPVGSVDGSASRGRGQMGRELVADVFNAVAALERLGLDGVADADEWADVVGRRATLANTLAELPLLDAAMADGEVPIEAARVIARAYGPCSGSPTPTTPTGPA